MKMKNDKEGSMKICGVAMIGLIEERRACSFSFSFVMMESHVYMHTSVSPHARFDQGDWQEAGLLY